MAANTPARHKTVKLTEAPAGFVYKPDLIDANEEAALAREIAKLPLKEFEFHGYLGRRRVVSFGWHYDYGEARLNRAGDMPDFILPLRATAAAFAGLKPPDLPHVLFTEYKPGTPIGWHRDRPVFDKVIGISLPSASTFRLRRRTAAGWERFNRTLEPRSAYLLSGEARRVWEHSIPPVDGLRYSVTFRSLCQD